MNYYRPLEYGNYYHIYNRGINGEQIFREITNYEHFLRLYAKHITPVAETFAWALLGNHFHILVRIFDLEEIEFIKSKDENKLTNYQDKKKYDPTRQFSHLFNAYAKSYNKKFRRTGGLFEAPFKRLTVDNHQYFRQMIFYIHNNPVHHGFCESMLDYPWSSYLSLISIKPTKLQREKVLGWFNSKAEFVTYHQTYHDFNDIVTFIIEDD